jgi:hypothetical protein
MQKLWVNERHKTKQQSQEQASIKSPKSNRKGPQVCLFLILFSEVQVSPEKNEPLLGASEMIISTKQVRTYRLQSLQQFEVAS